MFPRGKKCPIARVRWRCCWIEARRRFRHHECSVHNAINGKYTVRFGLVYRCQSKRRHIGNKIKSGCRLATIKPMQYNVEVQVLVTNKCNALSKIDRWFVVVWFRNEYFNTVISYPVSEAQSGAQPRLAVNVQY